MEEGVAKRTLPYSRDAEQSVLGAMILDPDAIYVCAELISGADFYQSQYGSLFDVMVELYGEGRSVDMVVLQDKIREKGLPEDVFTPELFRELVNAVPNSSRAREYAQIVREKAVLRRMIKATEEISNTCYTEKYKLSEVLEMAEKKIFDLVASRGIKEMEDIRTLVIRSMESIEAASKIKGSVTGIATGFYELDSKTAGLQPSDLILIAARPSMGKTAFALNIVEYVAVRNHIPTVMFSLEMTRDQLVKRMLSMNSKVDSQALRTGNLQDSDWVKLVHSASLVGNSELIIDDTPGISISELRSKCRKYKIEKNVGLVIVDYLQLMSGNRRAENRQQEISEISRNLKSIAREMNVPVVALSQLSRNVEGRPDKRPMLSDLRESGAIEQDADVVMFLYRDEFYNHDTQEPGVAEVIIGKQRNGPVGTTKLAWLAPYTKFANLQRQDGRYGQ